jgi:integrase/recombinase XerD
MALDHFVEFLRREMVIPPEKISRRRPRPTEQCVQAYQRYLREERLLAEATIANYVPLIRLFLRARFGVRPVKLSDLCARDVVQFVQKQARILHLRRAKLLTTALRSFLRYACYLGDVRLDLATVVPCVANWSMPSIPRGIASSQVPRLLGQIDRSTAVGRRDYAILLLLARLGLRSGEVASLELEDIDWKAGCLRVRGKSGSHYGLLMIRRLDPCRLGARTASGLQAIAKLTRIRETADKTSSETAYSLLSQPLAAERLNSVARALGCGKWPPLVP